MVSLESPGSVECKMKKHFQNFVFRVVKVKIFCEENVEPFFQKICGHLIFVLVFACNILANYTYTMHLIELVNISLMVLFVDFDSKSFCETFVHVLFFC